ncbi:DUF4082 domain-containing protein [Embleya sp. NPDC020630]|uniref:DUF4082 domain-containing protein n=1 Tax=Embleya sp. NPDC020630 TaxID=3363979 RepID=UPI00378962C2
MNIPWPRLRTATIPIVLAMLLALAAATPGTSRAAAPSQSGPCPCPLWSSRDLPSSGPDRETEATELGVRFRADQAGWIIGVRFWKDVANTGVHTGSLWSATGERLATATFVGESQSGWQQVNFEPRIPITAGTTYVASYHAPNGRYSADEGGLTAAHVNGPLTAPASADVGGNGVYRSGGPGFPDTPVNGTNFWVDVAVINSP